MEMSTALRHASGYRTTLPLAVREALRLKHGTTLVWTQTAPGVYEIRNATTLLHNAIAAEAA